MNFLAHLYLAAESPEWMVGAVLGDFLQGMDLRAFPPVIQEGVWRHRAIDRFTDDHPLVARSRARLRRPFRRWAGVLVDVFYDHFLAADWDHYSPVEPLEVFAGRAYDALTTHHSMLPPRLQRVVPHMLKQDWLTSCRTLDGVRQALERLSRRPRRENPLSEGVRQLEEQYSGLAEDFRQFFPELVLFVRPAGSRGQAGWVKREDKLD